MKKSVIEAMSSCSLFASLEESEIREIADKYAAVIECEKNKTIYSQTNYKRAIMIITKGRACVTKDTGNGKILMSILSRGDIFGMAALFYEKENFLTEITSLENTETLSIEKDNLIKIFKEYPVVSENYITILSEKIHFLNKKISTYTKPEAIGKVASFILQCADEEEKTSYLPYNISSVAEALNTGRASVYRAFDALEDKNIISRSGRKIEILDLNSLKNI